MLRPASVNSKSASGGMILSGLSANSWRHDISSIHDGRSLVNDSALMPTQFDQRERENRARGCVK